MAWPGKSFGDAVLDLLQDAGVVSKGEFREELHPRASGGQFGDKPDAGGAGAATAEKPKAPAAGAKPASAEAKPAGVESPDDLEKPITDIDEAIERLSNGKGVMFERPDQAVVLLDKMAAMLSKAKAEGKKQPVFDLCKVTVKGISLFCHENMKIPRDKMPQLSGKPREGSSADKLPKNKDGEVDLTDSFLAHLAERGVKVEQVDVQSSKMRASQNQLDGGKVGGMMRAIEAGKIKPSRIFVSRENYVVDGHHRWASNVGLNYVKGEEHMMPTHRVDMPILDLLKLANEFADAAGVGARGLGKWLDGVTEDLLKSVGVEKYSEDEARDERGRWTTSGGSGDRFQAAGHGPHQQRANAATDRANKLTVAARKSKTAAAHDAAADAHHAATVHYAHGDDGGKQYHQRMSQWHGYATDDALREQAKPAKKDDDALRAPTAAEMAHETMRISNAQARSGGAVDKFEALMRSRMNAITHPQKMKNFKEALRSEGHGRLANDAMARLKEMTAGSAKSFDAAVRDLLKSVEVRKEGIDVEKILKAGGWDKLPLTDKGKELLADAIHKGAKPSTLYTGKVMVDHGVPEEPPAFMAPKGLKVGDRVIPLHWTPMGVHGAQFDLFSVPAAAKVKKMYTGPVKVTKCSYPPGRVPADISKCETVTEDRLWGLELEEEGVKKDNDEGHISSPVMTKDTTMVLRLEPLATPEGEVG